MENVFDICSFFVKQGIRENKPVSNISIQKLLYFAQGFYLAENDKKLFRNKIYAWEYGPVVSEVYHDYKFFGNNYISSWREFKNSIAYTDGNISQENNHFILNLWDSFKEYHPFDLVKLTHTKGSPWYKIVHEDNRGVIPRDTEIPISLMRDYFSK